MAATKKSSSAEFPYVHVGVAALVGVGLGYALQKLMATPATNPYVARTTPAGQFIETRSLTNRGWARDAMNYLGYDCSRWSGLSEEAKLGLIRNMVLHSMTPARENRFLLAPHPGAYVETRNVEFSDDPYGKLLQFINVHCLAMQRPATPVQTQKLGPISSQLLATTSSSVQIPKSRYIGTATTGTSGSPAPAGQLTSGFLDGATVLSRLGLTCAQWSGMSPMMREGLIREKLVIGGGPGFLAVALTPEQIAKYVVIVNEYCGVTEQTVTALSTPTEPATFDGALQYFRLSCASWRSLDAATRYRLVTQWLNYRFPGQSIDVAGYVAGLNDHCVPHATLVASPLMRKTAGPGVSPSALRRYASRR